MSEKHLLRIANGDNDLQEGGAGICVILIQVEGWARSSRSHESRRSWTTLLSPINF